MSDSPELCPKCGHPRQAEAVSCERCGVVYHKYHQYLERKAALERERGETGDGLGRRLVEAAAWLLEPPESARSLWPAYAALWLAFTVWGWQYMATDIQTLGLEPGFMHHINLPFHEAGHLVFQPFGEWVGSLGGTLGQLLMPAICGVAIVYSSEDTFGASICLWWFGQNFLDIAPYMADARAGELPLLGGNYGKSSPYGFHDWEYILGETGLLAYDKTFAAITMNAGRFIMLGTIVWGAWLLWRAWQTRG